MALIATLNFNLNPAPPKQLLHPHHRQIPISLHSIFGAQHRKNYPSLNAVARRAAVRCCSLSETAKTILWSDVQVKKQHKRITKWSLQDLTVAGLVLAMHVLCLFAPWTFSWRALWTAVSLYAITGLLGITLSYHRNLSHKSFKLPKWLEYMFAYFGAQALQGTPMDWVSTHRYHHQYCDTDRDPHSPIDGFWFSHMNWFFDADSLVQRVSNVQLFFK